MDQIIDTAASERRALARFLKAMRERVTPQDAGIASGVAALTDIVRCFIN